MDERIIKEGEDVSGSELIRLGYRFSHTFAERELVLFGNNKIVYVTERNAPYGVLVGRIREESKYNVWRVLGTPLSL